MEDITKFIWKRARFLLQKEHKKLKNSLKLKKQNEQADEWINFILHKEEKKNADITKTWYTLKVKLHGMLNAIILRVG